MKTLSLRFWSYLAIDCILLAVCLLHIPTIVRRSTTPFEVGRVHDRLVVTRITQTSEAGEIRQGDAVIRIGSVAVRTPEEAEFVSDRESIGDTVGIAYWRAGLVGQTPVRMVPFYPSSRFAIITLFVGLSLWCVGVYILRAGYRSLAGRVLHWMLILFASVVMLTWGKLQPTFLETVVRPVLFFISYCFSVPIFFFFSALYPDKKPGGMRYLVLLTFVPAICFTAILSTFCCTALVTRSIDTFDLFQRVYDIFHASMFFYIGAGLIIFIRTYFSSRDIAARNQLRWILWGFAAGAIPFMFLFIVPQLFFSEYLVDEEYTTLFFLVIPLSFAVSFLKYPLPTIDVVVNRGLVYSILTLFIVASYILTVLVITSVIGGEVVFEHYLLLVALTILVGVVINPLRRRVQHYVDETLFAARADFGGGIAKAIARLHSAMSTSQLYSAAVESISEMIPASSISLFTVHDRSLALEYSKGPRSPSSIPLPEQAAEALKSAGFLVLPEGAGLKGADADRSQKEWLDENSFSLCLSVKSGTTDPLCVIALRARSRSETYDEHELEFLRTLSAEMAEVLQRLLLQEKLILESEAKRRSDELNELKSEILSNVSHEFRTPMTSIAMYTELLSKNKGRKDLKAARYLETIAGETKRLNRMVTNLLDAARIEKGMKEYALRNADLAEIVRGVLLAMEYQLMAWHCTVRTSLPKGNVIVVADPDAVAQAVENLVINSLKYSSGERFIRLEIRRKKDVVLLKVIDHGDGIAPEAIPHLFERFYRAHLRQHSVEGIGLGLPIVKHIMDAHGGTVEVESKEGKGSIFTLTFPKPGEGIPR
ncbi:MAG TPA: ATP-binding protein [Bacteroidota bacterium]|nr:ATP-binding protein [Bacteroidota bacterium]